MNREILFRGKRVHKLEHLKTDWVYGYLVINQDGTHYIKEDDYEVNTGRPDLIPTEVFPDTVGQFTGLYDRNNTKIFEGDILNLPEHLYLNHLN